jgi:hypothetical protein
MSTDQVSPRIQLVEPIGANQKVEQLEQRVAHLESQIGSLLSQLRILTLDYEAAKLFGHAKEWHFDVIEPNFYFNNVFPPELMPNGKSKRWVDQTARIRHAVCLPRHEAHTFTIDIVGFAQKSYSNALHLRIDGKEIKWSSIEGLAFTAEIPPLDNAFKVDFEVYIDPSVLLPDQSVSFSFRKISITGGSPKSRV